MVVGFDEGSGMWEVIIKYQGDISHVADKLGAKLEVLGNNFAILTLREADIPRLSSFIEIISVEKPRLLTYSLYESMREACVYQVHESGLSGKGVLVAVLDSGIDYKHPDFINPDGTSRIKYFWDQSSSLGNPPKGFSHGNEYTQEQLNASLSSPSASIQRLDDIGHGTAVAGAMAGNGRASQGKQKGAAYEASFVVVRLGERGRREFARTTELMRALRYVTDKAVSLGMPMCINISYGSNDGPHNSTSLFISFIDAISQEWKISIVVASGNEGAAGHHYASILSDREVRDIEVFMSAGHKYAYITIWKDFSDTFEFELISPSGRATPRLSNNNPYVSTTINSTSIIGTMSQPTHYALGQNIHYALLAYGSDYVTEGVWIVRIRVLNVVNGRIDMWLPTVEEVGYGTSFASPDNTGTLTMPSTSNSVITVGAYDANLGSIANFSGRGFVPRNGIVKPDIVAPGVGIIAPAIGGGYDALSGTSIAAPIVSGCAAVMMQWGIVNGNDPFLYGERIKAYLRLGAVRSPTIAYPNETWGYGRVCLNNTIAKLRDYNHQDCGALPHTH